MKFEFKTWTLAKLISLYNKEKLSLNPPYQRNDIWTLKQQKHLLNTISKGMPFPNFFLFKQGDKYEMVDGQQRSRTITGFFKGVIPNLGNRVFSELNPNERKHFKAYKIAVAIITNLLPGESMESYYVLVNSTGARLNRPELIKAEFFSTPFLKAIQALSENADWKELDIFTEKSKDRMNDIDFIGELFALIKFGPTEKKEKADELFRTLHDDNRIKALTVKFLSALNILKLLNTDTPIKTTRFRQKNDFYTLFQFIDNYHAIEVSSFKYYYRLLLKIAPHINPSQEECEPLMNYALNCVSQSNSKNAREMRYRFVTDLFLNGTTVPNPIQVQILKFFNVQPESADALKRVGNHFTLNIEKLILP